jgi:UDP-3-O-[3-hydroxymyristoyl] N-acetylglucosamine deacetylase
MSSIHQQTIASSISCEGIGIHSGAQVKMKILPAKEDSGIVFRVKNNNSNINIAATYDKVHSTNLCTSIHSADGKYNISTIEHLMAALWGCYIDNAIIELDNFEVPIMDGSSEQFVFMIQCAGIQQQTSHRKKINILKEISVSNNDSKVTLEPYDHFAINVKIDFNNSVIGCQEFCYDELTHNFKRDISKARTFGFKNEVDHLKNKGLIKGGNLDNAIVVDENAILNSDGLRYHNEFVKHKLLDCIGDLYLAGMRIKGKFTGYKSGHSLNNLLLRSLFSDKTAYEIIS